MVVLPASAAAAQGPLLSAGSAIPAGEGISCLLHGKLNPFRTALNSFGTPYLEFVCGIRFADIERFSFGAGILLTA